MSGGGGLGVGRGGAWVAYYYLGCAIINYINGTDMHIQRLQRWARRAASACFPFRALTQDFRRDILNMT